MDAPALPPGFELEASAPPAPSPTSTITPSMSPTPDPTAMPDGFELEGEPSQAPSEGVADTAAAFSRGVGTGLAGPVLPWIAKRLGETTEQAKGLEERHPVASGLGEFTGLTGGLMTGTGVGGIAVKAGEALPAIEGAGYLAKVGNSAVKQAAEMALISSSDEAAKMVSDPSRSAETALSNVGLATALGAGTGAIITGVVSPLWKATVGDAVGSALKNVSLDTAAKISDGAAPITMRPIIKKVLSTFGGVSEEDIDAYLKHHSDVQNIPEYQEVYEHALDHVGALSDAVEAGRMSVAEAKGAYKDLETSMRQVFRESGADVAEANSLASQALKEAQAKQANDLLSQAIGAGNKTATAVEALRDKVVKGSEASYDLLDRAKTSIKLDGFLTKAETVAKDLEAEGTLEARAQAERVRAYADNIRSNHGVEVSGPEAKQLIQGLDKVSKYDYNASTFDKGLSGSYKELRHELDSTLKDAVPEYRKAMEPLAKDSSLLGKLKRYGTEETASTRIKAMKNADVLKNEMPLLKELEERTGIRFSHEIEPYANPELRSKLLKSLPEYEEAQKTAEALAELRHPRARRDMEEMLQQSEEYKALVEAQQKLAAAEEEKAALKGVTPQTLQSKLNSIAKPGKSLANEEILSRIPAFQGKTIPEIMKLLRIQDAFNKNATRGSKHVNLYGMMLGALGSLGGHGLGGLGIGSAAGAFVDTSGPALVKKILDKYATGVGRAALAENPAAARTMLTKILGQYGDVSAAGFKQGTDYISNIAKGEKSLDRAVKNVFIPGAAVLRPQVIPDAASRLKLDRMVAKNQENKDDTAKSIASGDLSHYMGDHHGALAALAGNQLQYLATLRPSERRLGPMDKPVKPTAAEEARYARAQDIALDPKVILDHVKDGSLQVSDVQDLRAMYPQVYKSMVTKITGEIASSQAAGTSIPYKTRLSMSLLLGQPLDSTMTPASIQAAQPTPRPAPPQVPQTRGSKVSGKAMNSMNKNASSYQTGSQSAESNRTKH